MKKKVFVLGVIILGLFVFVSPVCAKNITNCNAALGSNVAIDEKIPNLVNLVIRVIKIAVPILLVILGMMDLVKGITAQKEDEIKKGRQILVKRLISGVLVFFVITIVQLIISLVGGNDEEGVSDCVNCFINNECTLVGEASNQEEVEEPLGASQEIPD